MSGSPTEVRPSRRHLRHYAWAIALILAVFAWQQGSSPVGWSLRLAAAIVFALGTVLPNLFWWPFVGLMLFCAPLLRAAGWRVPSLSEISTPPVPRRRRLRRLRIAEQD
jgi:hypothetical protein